MSKPWGKWGGAADVENLEVSETRNGGGFFIHREHHSVLGNKIFIINKNSF